MDNSILFSTLFRKYLDNRCSPDEVDQLMDFLKDDAYKQYADELIELQAAAQMDNHRPVDMALKQRLELRLQSILEADAAEIQVAQHHFLRRNSWWLAAASVILLLGTAVFIWLNRSPEKAVVVQVKPERHLKNDVMPGGNKAMLTLANGTTIILDDAANGQVANQGKTTIIKLNDGKLSYAASNSLPTGGEGREEVVYNTLATPRGGQYQLVLPDGSTVWLNAASSIRYPTAFTGNERKVEITGEAYFEVKPLAPKGEQEKVPFIVKIVTPKGEGGEIRVLGTHFNINAYDDEEAIKTTLLEGKVKVSKEGASALLQPGQQASVSQKSQSSQTIPVKTVDVEEVMAWKNGAFQFNGADIQTVMRQISRWYDVEVEYKGNISLHFAGTMSRNVNISQVLQMLEKAGGVKTSVTGKKITVMP